jgi:predicted transcriptional regulator
MKPVRQQKIRALLRKYPLGLTPMEIAEETGMHVSNVRTALRSMVDCYVDRWQPGKRGQFEKVWCAVYVPEDCPHPRDKTFRGGHGKPPKTVWQPIARVA